MYINKIPNVRFSLLASYLQLEFEEYERERESSALLINGEQYSSDNHDLSAQQQVARHC